MPSDPRSPAAAEPAGPATAGNALPAPQPPATDTLPQPSSKTSPYAALGGAPALQRLVDRFYDVMDEWPEAYNARRIHPDSLDGARQGLFEFLSGWLGGPPLYVQRVGHPRLRMRHRHYAIGPLERDEWMLCMREALREQVPDAALRQAIEQRLAALADHMVNTEARACSGAASALTA